MWFLLLLTTPYLGPTHAHKGVHEHEEQCFDHAHYIRCTAESTHSPSVCDCKDRDPCYIKLNITKVPEHPDIGIDPNDVFRINNGLIGPTIIAKAETVVVADVFNNIVGAPGDEDTSMHWHGMHQTHVPWMDGVGYVTQWPISPLERFRYIYRATPSGTHWYHSHMRSQRDKGLYGALIVREAKMDIHRSEKLGRFIDEPGKTTLVIREHIEEEGATDPVPCFPDNSQMPVSEEILDSFQINGYKLGSKINEKNLKPSFTVKPGKNYRFRLIGSMSQTIIRFSIDHHKLFVMSTDGYLTQPFETDVLIMHVGERYDFILKADKNIKPGTVYLIRIESVAVRCDDFSKPERIGFAYLRYTKGDDAEILKVKKHESRCNADPCIALNCPFKTYPVGASDVTLECHDVYHALKLLYPTPRKEIPAATYVPFERFFNFDAKRGIAHVNGIQFILPTVPFMNANHTVPDECEYNDTHSCESKPGEKSCPHVVHIPRQHRRKAIRFVFSSIPSKNGGSVTSLITHPIHLHGHSFFVSKIAYPTYDEKGEIQSVNNDLTIPDCGPGGWTNNVVQEEIRVDSETIRKDVIIVPAGGYVVVEFLADNPGYWFLHCHIDSHLLRGMGIVVKELPECQNQPPKKMDTASFCYSVNTFLQNDKNGICEEKKTEEKGHKKTDWEIPGKGGYRPDQRKPRKHRPGNNKQGMGHENQKGKKDSNKGQGSGKNVYKEVLADESNVDKTLQARIKRDEVRWGKLFYPKYVEFKARKKKNE